MHVSATNEFFFTTKTHEIRHEALFGSQCLDGSQRKAPAPLAFFGCHGMRGNQEWEYLHSKRLRHTISGLCLSAQTGDAVLDTCKDDDPLQVWEFSKFAGFTDTAS